MIVTFNTIHIKVYFYKIRVNFGISIIFRFHMNI